MSKTALVLQHSPEVRGGLFEEILLEQGWELEVLPLFLGSGLPSSSKEFGMVLALGGPMSANDEGVHPFLKKEIPFIRQVLKVGPPLLGIGLGAQLMAKALGAAVCPGPFKEIGWYWINQTPLARSDPLFSSLDPYLLVFEWHGETFDLPSEADGLAGNRAYPNQAFRLDESLSYGLQFHLEVTEPMIKTWLSSRVQGDQIGRPSVPDTRGYSSGCPHLFRQAPCPGQAFLFGVSKTLRKNLRQEQQNHFFQ